MPKPANTKSGHAGARPEGNAVKRAQAVAMGRAGERVAEIAAKTRLTSREVRKALREAGLREMDMSAIRIAPQDVEPEPQAEPDEPRRGPDVGSHGLHPGMPGLSAEESQSSRDARIRACRLHLADLVHWHGRERLTVYAGWDFGR